MSPSNPLYAIELGSGPPLLLIHGLFDSLETWEKIVPLLAERFRVFAIDLPAFGKSPLPEKWGGSVSGMIDAVMAFLDEKKLAKVTLVGSSMGGSLALGVAGRYTERVDRLVLLNPYGLPTIPVAVSIAQGVSGKLLPYSATKPTMRRLAKTMFRRSLYRPELVTDALIERVIRPFSTLRQRKNLFRFLQGLSPEEIKQVDALLPQIGQPVLILWGENDRWLSEEHAKRLQRLLPQSRISKLSACGHLPHMEKPKEVAEEITTFLGVKGRRSGGG